MECENPSICPYCKETYASHDIVQGRCIWCAMDEKKCPQCETYFINQVIDNMLCNNCYITNQHKEKQNELLNTVDMGNNDLNMIEKINDIQQQSNVIGNTNNNELKIPIEFPNMSQNPIGFQTMNNNMLPNQIGFPILNNNMLQIPIQRISSPFVPLNILLFEYQKETSDLQSIQFHFNNFVQTINNWKEVIFFDIPLFFKSYDIISLINAIKQHIMNTQMNSINFRISVDIKDIIVHYVIKRYFSFFFNTNCLNNIIIIENRTLVLNPLYNLLTTNIINIVYYTRKDSISSEELIRLENNGMFK